MKKYVLTFHEIMDTDITAITLHGEDCSVWSNIEAGKHELYANQRKEIEMDSTQLLFLVNTLELKTV